MLALYAPSIDHRSAARTRDRSIALSRYAPSIHSACAARSFAMQDTSSSRPYSRIAVRPCLRTTHTHAQARSWSNERRYSIQISRLDRASYSKEWAATWRYHLNHSTMDTTRRLMTRWWHRCRCRCRCHWCQSSERRRGRGTTRGALYQLECALGHVLIHKVQPIQDGSVARVEHHVWYGRHVRQQRVVGHWCEISRSAIVAPSIAIV